MRWTGVKGFFGSGGLGPGLAQTRIGQAHACRGMHGADLVEAARIT
jgi:hypothetical protein